MEEEKTQTRNMRRDNSAEDSQPRGQSLGFKNMNLPNTVRRGTMADAPVF